MFEYILAADDFLLFKSIMVKRNVELDIQAVEMMKVQAGMRGSVHVATTSQATEENEEKGSTGEEVDATSKAEELLLPSKRDVEEDTLLLEVLERSRREFEDRSYNEEELQSLMEAARHESMLLCEMNSQTDIMTEQMQLALVLSASHQVDNTARLPQPPPINLPQNPPASIASGSLQNQLPFSQQGGRGPSSGDQQGGRGPSSGDQQGGRGPSSSDQQGGHGPSSGDQQGGRGPSSGDQQGGRGPSSGDQQGGHGPGSGDQQGGRGPGSGDQQGGRGPGSGDQQGGRGPGSGDQQGGRGPSSGDQQGGRGPSSGDQQGGRGPSSGDQQGGRGPSSGDQQGGRGPSSGDQQGGRGPSSGDQQGGRGPSSGDQQGGHGPGSGDQQGGRGPGSGDQQGGRGPENHVMLNHPTIWEASLQTSSFPNEVSSNGHLQSAAVWLGKARQETEEDKLKASWLFCIFLLTCPQPFTIHLHSTYIERVHTYVH